MSLSLSTADKINNAGNASGTSTQTLYSDDDLAANTDVHSKGGLSTVKKVASEGDLVEGSDEDYPFCGDVDVGELTFDERPMRKLESDKKFDAPTPVSEGCHRCGKKAMPLGAASFDKTVEMKTEKELNSGAKCTTRHSHEICVDECSSNTKLFAPPAGVTGDSIVSKPKTHSASDQFEQRLKMKLEQDGNSVFASINVGTLNVVGTNAKAIEPKQGEVSGDTVAPKSKTPAVDAFQQRLRMKLEREGNGEFATDRVSTNDEQIRMGELLVREEDEDSCLESSKVILDDNSFCSEENEASGVNVGGVGTGANSARQVNFVEDVDDSFTDAEMQIGLDRRDTDINFDDVLLDLQRFKEENGNLEVPSSHPSISRFLRKLSIVHIEPLAQSSSRLDSQQAGPRRQGIQSGENGIRNLIGNVQQSVRNFFLGSGITAEVSGYTAEVLISATLVEEVEGEVVMAERVGFFERKWKLFVILASVMLALLVGILSLSLTGVINIREEMFFETSETTVSQTFDPRTTLEIIRERGHVRCGLLNGTISAGEGFLFDLCRSVAAVIVGNPDGFEEVLRTSTNRWQLLDDRSVDLLVSGDTYTIEREINELYTGAGFSFSSPYNYDGMVYYGNSSFVRCAEEQKRFDECAGLLICVTESSTHHDFLKKIFPSEYFTFGSSLEEIAEMLFDESCNVGAYDKSAIQSLPALNNGIRDRNFVIGNKMMTKEPLSIVTRNTDREFSDIINWVVQALFFGEEQGLTKNLALCQSYSASTSHHVSDLDFMNAVHCVGNYRDLLGVRTNNRGRNQINNGTGMLYAIPFGDLDRDMIVEPATGITLTKIRANGFLNCGVVVPVGFEGSVTRSDRLVGMGVDCCRALAAALFLGDYDDVKFTTFPETDNSSFVALANETIDVLVGGRVQRKYDFQSSSMLQGLHFSTPYYYGNETVNDGVSFYSMATREDDTLFSSFVNCIVLATIHAQENRIHRVDSADMPLVSVFGNDLKWALRDATAYSGSYDEIYSRNFGSRVPSIPQRNTLNDGGPLILSFPASSMTTND